jgi:hypothetical protein
VKEVVWTAAHPEGLLRVGSSADRRVAEWTGLARLECGLDGSGAEVTFAPGVSPRRRDKIKAGVVEAFKHDLAGGLALHASAAVKDDAAVVLLGPSDAGKSTMAAALVQRGWALAADDVVVLEEDDVAWWVRPTEAHSWLEGSGASALGVAGPDAARAPYALGAHAERRAAVAAVVVLRFESTPAPELVRLRGVRALEAFLTSVIRFATDDPARRLREVDQVTGLLTHAPLFVLARPRDLDLLGANCDGIARAVRASRARP